MLLAQMSFEYITYKYIHDRRRLHNHINLVMQSER